MARYKNVNLVAGNDPCASIATASSLTFPYNRRAAANYAIEHSYQNDGLPDPLAGNRVTRRLTNNQSPNPIPFANFKFSYLSGDPDRTGSAVFVSESIWAGGLPMTIGDPASCSNSQVFNESGWRYCSNNIGSSNSWDFHQALVAYFTSSQAPSTTQLWNTTNAVLVEPPYANEGSQLAFPSSSTLFNDRVWGGRELASNDFSTDLLQFLPNPFTGVVTDAAGLAGFASANFASVKAGDYILIDPFQTNDAHGLLVIGWAPVENCSTALNTRRTINNFQQGYTSSVPNIVPYVADFTRAQSPTARPFYCSLFQESGGFINFARHDWYFYKLPNSITLQKAKVYVDPNWQWTSANGNYPN